MKALIIFSFTVLLCASALNLEQRKAKLVKDLSSNTDHHHSHSHSWERRRNRYWYAGRYRYRPYQRYPYRRPYNDYDYNDYGGRQYNQQPPQVFTTAPPFPFNLFGKK